MTTTRHLSTSGEPWWRTACFAQIWPRSYADANGDGCGDLAGIVQHLDHLDRLGIDAIWLSPVYPSPMHDAGYDVADYCDIDPVFGSLADFDALIGAVHDRGIRLVLDMVPNHTSVAHPWFEESRASTGNARRDWYWWRPPRAGHRGGEPGSEPNNWRSVFGGPAWTFDDESGEYYLHLFSAAQPDLNWENPEVRRALHTAMRWWIDRGVDGFRLDVVNVLSKNPTLADVPSPNDTLAHVADGPRVHEYLAELHREVLGGRRDIVLIGETPRVTLDDARRYTAPESGELHMIFQFDHVEVDHGPGGRFDPRPFSLPELKHRLARWQTGLDDGWNSLYWCNHDQPRVVSRFGDDTVHRARSAKALATVLHLHRGTPFVYQGEELGMANMAFSSLDELRDIESLRFASAAAADGVDEATVMEAIRFGARDHARTPMQWDASPNAGFSTAEPWMRVNPDHVHVNVAAQAGDASSVLAHHRLLIAMRHALPVVVDGDFTLLLADHDRVWAFLRRLGDDALLVVANISGEPVEVDLASTLDLEQWADAPLVLSTLTAEAHAPVAEPLGAHTRLAPWEARVHRRVR